MFQFILFLGLLTIKSSGSLFCESVSAQLIVFKEHIAAHESFATELENQESILNDSSKRFNTLSDYLEDLYSRNWTRLVPVFTEKELYSAIRQTLEDSLNDESNVFISAADKAVDKHGAPLISRLLSEIKKEAEVLLSELKSKVETTRDQFDTEKSILNSERDELLSELDDCLRNIESELSRIHMDRIAAHASIRGHQYRTNLIKTSIDAILNRIYPQGGLVVISPTVLLPAGTFSDLMSTLLSPKIPEYMVDTFINSRITQAVVSFGGAVYADTLLHAMLNDFAVIQTRMMAQKQSVLYAAVQNLNNLSKERDSLEKERVYLFEEASS